MKDAAEFLRGHSQALGEEIIARQYERQPELWAAFGVKGREKSTRDAVYLLSYLAEAIEASDPILFGEYIRWLRVLLDGLHFPDEVLLQTIDCTRQVLVEQLPPENRAAVLEVFEAAVQRSIPDQSYLASYLDGASALDDLARRFQQALLASDYRNAGKMILDAVAGGTGVKDIYLQVFQRSQREIGRLWQTNRISVAQEHYCSAATQTIMSQLYPHIFSGSPKNHKAVIACISGELHEIGARMVADFLEMQNWDTYFIGANAPPGAIAQAVSSFQADVLALSATMTFHTGTIRETINSVRTNPAIAGTRILVGGYPFNLSSELWKRVGADGYALDAQSAVREAERLVA